jgi:quercetin dioxygenase-like cupin family protein
MRATSGHSCSRVIRIICMKVEHWDAQRDGPLNERALCRKLEKLGYSVCRYTYRAGTYFPPHTHGEDKMDAVVFGRFQIRMGGAEVVLEAGDAVHVPRGAEHSAEVVGAEPVVSLDAVKVS